MKVNFGNFFKALPTLVAAAEQIYVDEKAGSAKKASVMSLIGVGAEDALKAVPAVLNPSQTTIAEAVSAEIDNIVAGYNAAGWPGAVEVGAVTAPGVIAAVKAA